MDTKYDYMFFVLCNATYSRVQILLISAYLTFSKRNPIQIGNNYSFLRFGKRRYAIATLVLFSSCEIMKYTPKLSGFYRIQLFGCQINKYYCFSLVKLYPNGAKVKVEF